MAPRCSRLALDFYEHRRRALKLYNTLTASKEEFQPTGDTVKMYVCGVTPYAPAHVGHAMSYIIFDVIRRYLEFKRFTVRYVQNFTDVDDKIINQANKAGISPAELADRNIADYFADMDALNIKRADVYPRVTGEMPNIIDLIAGLVANGHAYVAEGDVYFRVVSKPDYGKLAHRSLDDMMAGARVEVDERKEHPMDFALWKAAKPGEPSWSSPWGPGRPGWHIECSSMILRHLGDQIDIHGGGQDLIFPHHENEIAQSESFTGKIPFVRYWLHNGLLQLAGEKMSKSIGNLVSIKEALDVASADALRLFVLSSHYRSPLTFSLEGLQAMERGADRLRAAAAKAEPVAPNGKAAGAPSPLSAATARVRQGFIEAMDDDFNTAAAVAQLFDLVREINRAREQGTQPAEVASAQATLHELSAVLGFTLETPSRQERMAAKPFIDLLVAVRQDLRAAKQFALADRIRQGLSDLGIVLEDRAGATAWKEK